MNVSRAVGVVWRDLCLNLVLAFIAMVIQLLPFVNPPGKDEATAQPVGNIVVSVNWPQGNTDIDTWVLGPGETRPVGYSNRAGQVFNLLRDDLGNRDPELNYESVISRGIPAGRYWINLHAYRVPDGLLPVPVTVSVEIHRGDGKKGMTKVASTTVDLRKKGDERTAFSFELTADGALVANSLNSVFRPLRAASGYSSGNNPDYGD